MWRDLFQPTHLLILVLLIVVLVGWKKLPDAARSIGRSARIFKSEMSEMKNDGKDAKESPAATDTIAGQVVDQTTQDATGAATNVPTGDPVPNAQEPATAEQAPSSTQQSR